MLGAADSKGSEIETYDDASFNFGVVVGIVVYKIVLVGGFTEHAKIKFSIRTVQVDVEERESVVDFFFVGEFYGGFNGIEFMCNAF